MIRLDRFVAETTEMTRSVASKAIRGGQVSVNNTIVRSPEMKIDEDADVVLVGGKECLYHRFRYLMLDKPTGVITASRDRRQETVLDLIPAELRRLGLFPVGRLDKDTSGLLFLTNDGEFAHRIISPRYAVSKVYYATVALTLSADAQEQFKQGIKLADGTQCLPAELELLEHNACRVTVQEGKYHQVRRMLAAVGSPVVTLRRLSVGGVEMDPAVGAGGWRDLDEQELCILFKLIHMEK